MNTEFFGRLHPLLVHLPIGILILGFILEVLSYLRRFRKVKGSVPVIVFIGTFSSVLSVATGFFLSDEGGYEPDLLFRHRLFAFMTLAISIMLLVVINYGKYLPKSRRKPARMIVFFILMAILTITGNFGGALTHGRGYLSPETGDSEPPAPTSPGSTSRNTPVLIYDQIIAPVLQEKCTGCHGEKKQKGKLRLDSRVAITKGGTSGPILLNSGNRSQLLSRITLPQDHEDHMPPAEKPQLTGLEIELISGWVNSGASFEETTLDISYPAIEKWLEQNSLPEAVSRWPEEPVDKPSEKAVATLKENFGVLIQPVSMKDNYLEITIPPALKPNAAFWSAYDEILPNIVTINLSGAEVDEKTLSQFCKAPELRKLYLTGSKIRKGSLSVLRSLKHLRYLNLVSAKITMDELNLISSISALEEVYIYGHALSPQELRNFVSGNPDLKIDTGNYRLAVRPTDTLIFRP